MWIPLSKVMDFFPIFLGFVPKNASLISGEIQVREWMMKRSNLFKFPEFWEAALTSASILMELLQAKVGIRWAVSTQPIFLWHDLGSSLMMPVKSEVKGRDALQTNVTILVIYR